MKIARQDLLHAYGQRPLHDLPIKVVIRACSRLCV